uniref:Uncharacterized protein n=1 Tax=Cacopsylla melanoneura TaxID=428564 RepID=A0A8D8ZGX0_9HEMI
MKFSTRFLYGPRYPVCLCLATRGQKRFLTPALFSIVNSLKVFNPHLLLYSQFSKGFQPYILILQSISTYSQFSKGFQPYIRILHTIVNSLRVSYILFTQNPQLMGVCEGIKTINCTVLFLKYNIS